MQIKFCICSLFGFVFDTILKSIGLNFILSHFGNKIALANEFMLNSSLKENHVSINLKFFFF